jgi:hypothetical protein
VKHPRALNPNKQKAPESTSIDACEEVPGGKKKKEKIPIHNGSNFVFNKIKNPFLFLLFDLGAIRAKKSSAPPVEVSYSSNIENVSLCMGYPFERT